MNESVGHLISDVAEGVARGVARLRESGIPLELDGFSVETQRGSELETTAINFEFVAPPRETNS